MKSSSGDSTYATPRPSITNPQFALERTNSQTLPDIRRISGIQDQRHLSICEGVQPKKPQARDPWPSDHEFLVMLNRFNHKEASCGLELPVNEAVQNRGYRLKTAKFQKTVIKLEKMVELTSKACHFDQQGQNASQEAINVHNAFSKIVDDIHELFRHVPQMIPSHPVHLLDTSPFCSKNEHSPRCGARKQVQRIKAQSQHKLHKQPKPCAYKVLRGICWFIKILDGVYNFSKHCRSPHVLIPGKQSELKRGISIEMLQSILLNQDEWPRDLLPEDSDKEEDLARKLEMNIMYVFFSGSLIRLLTLTSAYVEIWLSQLNILAARSLVEQWYQEHIMPPNLRKENQTPAKRSHHKKQVFNIANDELSQVMQSPEPKEEEKKKEEKEDVKQEEESQEARITEETRQQVKEEVKQEEVKEETAKQNSNVVQQPVQKAKRGRPKKENKEKKETKETKEKKENKEKKEKKKQVAAAQKAKKESQIAAKMFPILKPVPQRYSAQEIRSSLLFVRPTLENGTTPIRLSLSSSRNSLGNLESLPGDQYQLQDFIHHPPRNSSFLSNMSAFRPYGNERQ